MNSHMKASIKTQQLINNWCEAVYKDTLMNEYRCEAIYKNSLIRSYLQRYIN